MPELVLQDTSLCAIVRDEMMNPAGGIVDFVESTVPFVEKAVIVDTGSVDGTKQALAELVTQYDNLCVYHRQFDNFANSRNFSLSKVKTRRALILDADERLTEQDFIDLALAVEEQPAQGYSFEFKFIYPPGSSHPFPAMGLRLVELEKRPCFVGKAYENWDRNHFPEPVAYLDIEIKHFCPSDQGIYIKEDYYRIIKELSIPRLRRLFGTPVPPPSKLPHFEKWRAYNPRREEYR